MMKQKYYFSFLFNHINFENDIEENLEGQTNFEIQIIKNKKTAGKTKPIPLQLIRNHRITLEGETIKFTTLFKQKQHNTDICQIRLLQILPGGNRLLGSYQFAICNYIQAHKQLNRSCIEMVVEISQNFTIDYVAYMESTQQALAKIMQQHESAKKMQIMGSNQSQYESFLPQQINKVQLQEDCRQIKFDLYSPLIIQKRFWSPKRKREADMLQQKLYKINQPQQSDSTQYKNKLSESQKKMTKIQKKYSTVSDYSNNIIVRKLFNQKKKIISNIMENQVQRLAKQEDGNKNFQQLYEVIGNNSNINVSKETQQQHCKEMIKQKQDISVGNKTSKQDYLSKIGLKNAISLVIFLILMVLVFINISQSKLFSQKGQINSEKNRKRAYHKLKD